jgi:hypothetical protein
MNALEVGLALLSLLPLPLILHYVHPKIGLGVCVVVVLVSVTIAVALFCLWQWLQQPVLAYLDAAMYGLIAVLAILLLLVHRWTPADPAGREK